MKTTILPLKHSMNLSPVRLAFPLILLAFVCFALAPMAWPDCQEGCDLNQKNTFLGDNALIQNISGRFNTATGAGALSNNTTGVGNTAMGEDVLSSNTTGSLNTATGVSALSNNTTGAQNTATGVDALESNTTGLNNTANGFKALQSNTEGSDNTASDTSALQSNITGPGSDNTAVGSYALNSNKIGSANTAIGRLTLRKSDASNNTAVGAFSLRADTTGSSNTANGVDALESNTTGSNNTANGANALFENTTGFDNTADGASALELNKTGNNNTATGIDALLGNTTGSNNVALGSSAGSALTTGSSNIDIGNVGVAAESRTIRVGTAGTQRQTFIAGISGASVTGTAIVVNSGGQLGVAPSSQRFKQDIRTMGDASDTLMALRPVTFQYKPDVDPIGVCQFGLVAEEVEKVNPDLVARDEQGKPYTVRYEAVNAMLLNEFLKEHKKVEEQQATIAQLKSTVAQQQKGFETKLAKQEEQIEMLTAGLQKVSAQLEMSKSEPHTVVTNQ